MPHIKVERGAMQDPAPLPPTAMGFNVERLAFKAPRCGKVALDLLTSHLKLIQLLGEVGSKLTSRFDVENPRVNVGADDGVAAHSWLLPFQRRQYPRE